MGTARAYRFRIHPGKERRTAVDGSTSRSQRPYGRLIDAITALAGCRIVT
jgi:hypothetical protein